MTRKEKQEILNPYIGKCFSCRRKFFNPKEIIEEIMKKSLDKN